MAAVDVGDLSVWGDCYKRVETCLDQAPVVGICQFELFFGMFSLSDVPGRGEHADDCPGLVAVHCGIVQDRRDVSVRVPDFQGIVHDRTFPEYLLVPGPGLVRVREILGKIRADQILAADGRSPSRLRHLRR